MLNVHAALALISKQAPLLTTVYAVNTVQFKVNGTDPYMAMVYLHMGLLFCVDSILIATVNGSVDSVNRENLEQCSPNLSESISL
jgi:hypothetical protein